MRPAEAVAIVRELALQVAREQLPGVPSAHVVRLSSDGRLFIEGPVAADDRSVARAAHLLETVLPAFDAPPELRAPGALRLVIARALGTLDLPAYSSVQAFADALARFAHPDATTVVRELVASWSASVEGRATGEPSHEAAAEPAAAPLVPISVELSPAVPDGNAVEPAAAAGELTVSDIRRARRATGLTLGEVSTRSRIPVWLLRELEWGYLRNWPGGLYGRTQLLRYARAAGLDGELVIQTVWPMLQDDARRGVEVATIDFDEPLDGTVLGPVVPDLASHQEHRRPSRRRWLAALAIPALLAIGVAPALWDRASSQGAQPETVATRTQSAEPARRPAAPAETAVAAPGDTAVPAPAETAVAAPGDTAVPAPTETSASAPLPVKPPVPAVKEPAVNAGAGDKPHPQSGIPNQPAYSPAFASVGSAMFYHSEEDGRTSLMRADTDSRGAILRITSVVDDRARNFHARPSPDGTRIAFDSDREGERAVYVADSDGRNVRRISGEGFAAIPSWSPDGRALAYVRAEPDKPRVWNLWISDLETGRERRVTSFRYGQPWGGSWFPDGRRIAYSHEDRLIIRDLTTGRERIFKSPVQGKLVRTPAVSPDGRRIIFQVMRDGAWLLDVPDGAMRKVLSDATAEEYTWAPDGRRVAYHSRRSGDWGVWVMAAR